MIETSVATYEIENVNAAERLRSRQVFSTMCFEFIGYETDDRLNRRTLQIDVLICCSSRRLLRISNERRLKIKCTQNLLQPNSMKLCFNIQFQFGLRHACVMFEIRI